jgi:transposase-like protein
MGANLTELVDTGEKRDAQGRHIYTPEQRAELLAAYAKSRLTQRAFAKREGVKYHTLVEWLYLERHSHRAKPGPPPFRELSLGARVATPSAMLEVRLPGGMIVRGENAAAVAELVRALQRSAN